ncbi:hypothetical protein B0H13DRAFT_2343330 [Mycena leptocephala]|nr:hypothetical protein B0H13DRAFT_2343330 [Mycena leptocephala]
MPVGKGGFPTVRLYIDVYSQKNWGFKFTGFGTTRTTIQSLKAIRKGVRMPEVFVADQGSHFTGTGVAQFWAKQEAPIPLKRLCAPRGQDEWAKITSFDRLPTNCPDYCDEAIQQLNELCLGLVDEWAKITSFDRLPTNCPDYCDEAIQQLNELCLELVVNTTETPVELSSQELSESAIGIQNRYVIQENLDAYSHILEHANKRRAAFDKKVPKSRDGVVEYKKGDLVQMPKIDTRCSPTLNQIVLASQIMRPRPYTSSALLLHCEWENHWGRGDPIPTNTLS